MQAPPRSVDCRVGTKIKIMCGKCVRENVFGWYERKPDVTLKIPIPPSVNSAFNNAKVGRVKTEVNKKWYKAASDSLWTQKRANIKGHVNVVYSYAPPEANRKRDCANYEKCISDFLVDMGIIEDDSKIMSNTQRWLPEKGGYVICEIFSCA